MSSTNKTFEELDVIDDSLINAIATDPEVKEEFMRFDELMEYAKQEGMRRGLEEGREAGLAEGREAGLAEGRAEAKVQAILELLEMNGIVPKEIEEIILAQEDYQTLSGWLKLAAKSDDISQFAQKMKK